MSFKVERNYFENVHRNEITSKSEVQTTLVFEISKKRYKNDNEQPRICISFPSKIASKNASKQRRSKLGRKN